MIEKFNASVEMKTRQVHNKPTKEQRDKKRLERKEKREQKK